MNMLRIVVITLICMTSQYEISGKNHICSRLQNSPYIGAFKYRRFTDFFNEFEEKKPDCFAVYICSVPVFWDFLMPKFSVYYLPDQRYFT